VIAVRSASRARSRSVLRSKLDRGSTLTDDLLVRRPS
jgi:hypothetical protein